jgi:hypothetical protein
MGTGAFPPEWTCRGVKLTTYSYAVKVKLSLCFDWAPRHEGVLGGGGIAPLILWPRHEMEVSGQLHALAALPPGKEPLLPIGWEAGWAQSRSGRGGEGKNSQPRRESKPEPRSSSP